MNMNNTVGRVFRTKGDFTFYSLEETTLVGPKTMRERNKKQKKLLCHCSFAIYDFAAKNALPCLVVRFGLGQLQFIRPG
jgi:hypothetical protein